MSFLLPCPNCGPRSVYEFQYGGEYQTRPQVGAPARVWTRYLYLRKNSTGDQTEWWYHQLGCRQWCLALRNPSTNRVHATFRPQDLRIREASTAEE